MRSAHGAEIKVAFLGLMIASSSALSLSVRANDAAGMRPVADAGLSQYAAQDPVQLDGTGSYDPDGSGTLTYSWRQIAGPSTVISDAGTATPTISGFMQTDEIRECEFELVVSDGELASLPDTVKVIVVKDFSSVRETYPLIQRNPPFDPSRPTIVGFGGGETYSRGYAWSFSDYCSPSDGLVWHQKANVVTFDGYHTTLYEGFGDMLIVYLCAQAPAYRQQIQTMGHSAGGQPAADVAAYVNETYADARFAVNRVTLFDVTPYINCTARIERFLDSHIKNEPCWLESYVCTLGTGRYLFHESVLNVDFYTYGNHSLAPRWYCHSITGADMNQFNGGLVAGAYWSVVGPGKNLQLASTPGVETYKFRWYGGDASGHMDFFHEPNHPGRLPEPVALVGPPDGANVDGDGAMFSCAPSANSIGYQLLFGSDPDRMVYLLSETPSPPEALVTTFPYEQAWWTTRAYDQYGSTIHADPICIHAGNVVPQTIENAATTKRYPSIQQAIDDASDGQEIVISPGIYQYLESIEILGKDIVLRSTDPDDPTSVAKTVINGGHQSAAITLSGSGHPEGGCVLAGLTVTGGTIGISCRDASPTIRNCTVASHGPTAINYWDLYAPTVIDCNVLG